MTIDRAATTYLDAGLCVLPAIRGQKRPAVGSWKPFQTRLPTRAELAAWMARGPDAICLVCGEVSGGLETIDFDGKAELFDAWAKKIPQEIFCRLVIELTQNDGVHVSYRHEGEQSGNLKLAQRLDADGKIATLIETRGEGGLFLCAPTEGYELLQGEFTALPRLPADERDILLQAAWELNEYVPPVVDGPQMSTDIAHNLACGTDIAENGHCRTDNAHNPQSSADSAHNPTLSASTTDNPPILAHNADSRVCRTAVAERPGDDFNRRGDVRAVLQQRGWVCVKGGRNEYWRRPGKPSSKGGWSATLKDGVFYVFSANAAPFEASRAYSPFSVYTLLNCGGDYEQAARSLRDIGYGGDYVSDSASDADISAIIGQGHAIQADNSDSAGRLTKLIQPLRKLIDAFDGLNPPVIHGVLREGETMNVIAAPKMGKSWFVSALAISVASGLDWLGMRVEPGRVLHIDNELHSCTSAHRYEVISEAMGVPHHLYSENIDLVSLRGQLRDLYAMGQLFEAIRPGDYKLVIIDAFYRTLPRDTDENDNGAIANLYNRIDHYAARMKCAFVLIHHTSKGNQSGKSVTDVGAGAGSQSRAADTHLVLRPHEEENTVVLESAVRSWPPMAPKALLWQWPLFIPTDAVDTSALLGVARPKAKAAEIAVDDFVDACIVSYEPCSKNAIHYEASRRLGLGERKADEMLELAMERGLISRIRTGSQMRYVLNRPGISGDKALWVAALLAREPSAGNSQIAEMAGVSDRYVRQIRGLTQGVGAELGAELARNSPELVPELGGTSSGVVVRK